MTWTTIEPQGRQITYTSNVGYGIREEIITIHHQKDQAAHPHRATDRIQLRQ
jgi:hypothetical protein